MTFWILIFCVTFCASLSGIGAAAIIAWLHRRRQLMLTKIERGNAAFEHLMRPAPPPSNVAPFPKKAE